MQTSFTRTAPQSARQWSASYAVLAALLVAAATSLTGCQQRTPAPKVVIGSNTPRPDLLELGPIGAKRTEHGGDAPSDVKMTATPYPDGHGYTYFANGNVVRTEEMYKSVEGQPHRQKSRAEWDKTGEKVVSGQVWRRDGSVWLEYHRLPDGTKETRYFTAPTQERPSFLFLKHLVRPSDAPAAKAAKVTEAPKVMPKAEPIGMPKAVETATPAPATKTRPKTLDTIYLRPNGRIWATEQQLWVEPYTEAEPESGEESEVAGHWEKQGIDLFADDDGNRREWHVEWTGSSITLTHLRDDGIKKDFVANWSANSTAGSELFGMTFNRLQSVEEYDQKGELSRSLSFDQSSDPMSLKLASITLPQGKDKSKVLNFSYPWAFFERWGVAPAGTVLDDLGAIKTWNAQSKTWSTVERKRRFLTNGKVASIVIKNAGKEERLNLEPGRNDRYWPVDPRLLKLPGEMPFWKEFFTLQREQAQQDLDFLGLRIPGDRIRWYFQTNFLEPDEPDGP